MRRVVLTLALAFEMCTIAPMVSAQSQDNAKGPSDDEIRSRLVRESIASYAGACPCPESQKSNGALCGDSSAYSRPGGERPLCYATQVTDEMIKRYRATLPKQ